MRIQKVIQWAVVLALFSRGGTLQATTPIPHFTAPVVDAAGILSKKAQIFLDDELTALRRSGGSQIAVLTMPRLEDETIEQYGIRVADAWKPGEGKVDNGVLFVISVADHKMRIEVGRGLEGQLTDVYASRIIREKIEPLFREGDYDSGVIAGVAYIVHYTDPDYRFGGDQNPQGQGIARARHGHRSGGLGIIPLLIIFVIFIIFSILRGLLFGFGGPRRNGPWGPGGGGFFGGGGGDGGFSGGGGGGFSGGGASGGW